MLKSGQPSGREAETRSRAIGMELKVPVLAALVDNIDLYSFFHDPACRRTLNEVLDAFSDEEFDRFERFYVARFTLN